MAAKDQSHYILEDTGCCRTVWIQKVRPNLPKSELWSKCLQTSKPSCVKERGEKVTPQASGRMQSGFRNHMYLL